jgi:uncharacterized membrane protein (DUF485 family)
VNVPIAYTTEQKVDVYYARAVYHPFIATPLNSDIVFAMRVSIVTVVMSVVLPSLWGALSVLILDRINAAIGRLRH